MKGLIFATLAMTLLGGASALAQSHSAESSVVGKIAGKTFYAVDGSSLSFLAYQGGLAREIHTANGAVIIETLALKNRAGGTVSVSEDGSASAGTFKLTGTALAMDYKDGRSELLTANESGGLELVAHDVTGKLTCTAWYQQGHHFSEADVEAALIEVSAGLDLDTPPTAARESCAPGVMREARGRAHRRTAQNSGTVTARLPE
jgi:hypothetical protein